MDHTALRVSGLGKLYQLGPTRHGGSLREAIVAKFTGAGRRASDPLVQPHVANHIWALKNISFQINKGETVGIIGPNGSGKSTLLKILAEITEPTEGEVCIDGRLTALIELGAGFHPELSGRENIYLNGTILGLSKQLIDRNFDEILDFAELRDFVDTPLKHYSSGMTVRLGFSLAVHANPDILLVDEVLAVGDAAFRQRCFSKIDEFIRAKKTIVIVTHNLAEAQRVAQRLILIHKGQVIADGAPDQVIEKYATLLPTFIPSHSRTENALGVDTAAELPITITGVQVADGDGQPMQSFRTHGAMQLRISYMARELPANPVFRVQIYRSDGIFCHGINSERQGLGIANLNGAGVITLAYPDLALIEGEYSIHAAVFLAGSDELPVHQWFNPPMIYVESRLGDGAGIFAMPTRWSFPAVTPTRQAFGHMSATPIKDDRHEQ